MSNEKVREGQSGAKCIEVAQVEREIVREDMVKAVVQENNVEK